MEEFELKLIRSKRVTSEQLSAAKQEALRLGKSMWSVLVRRGHLTEEDVFILFAQESALNYVSLTEYAINADVFRGLSESFCREYQCIPLFKVKNTLYIACSDPFNTAFLDRLSALSESAVEPLIASPRAIQQALDSYYGQEADFFKLENLLFKKNPLRGVPFHRESGRRSLSVPVRVSLEGQEVRLRCASPIDGVSCNISESGMAVGLQVFLFLPKGLEVSIEFKLNSGIISEAETVQAKGEIVYCNIQEGKRYYLGIKFIELSKEGKNKLLKLAAG
ncbi:MAG: PilZ domain-containing protein [Candidatus Omnitrophota bacterium]